MKTAWSRPLGQGSHENRVTGLRRFGDRRARTLRTVDTVRNFRRAEPKASRGPHIDRTHSFPFLCHVSHLVSPATRELGRRNYSLSGLGDLIVIFRSDENDRASGLRREDCHYAASASRLMRMMNACLQLARLCVRMAYN
jgi:hypothetical protein